MVNESFFPKDGYGLSHAVETEGFKYPHLQLRGVSATRGNTRILDSITLEARGGDLIAVLATKGE